MKLVTKALAILALLLSALTPAYSVPVVGTVKVGPAGAPFTGKGCWTLSVGGQLSGAAILPGAEKCWPITNGKFVGADVVANDTINPQGTYYTVRFLDAFGRLVDTRKYAVTTGLGTWDIGTAVALTATDGTLVYVVPAGSGTSVPITPVTSGMFFTGFTGLVFTKGPVNYEQLVNKPSIPNSLSDLTSDATHRLVTDTEKSTWNSKAAANASTTVNGVVCQLGGSCTVAAGEGGPGGPQPHGVHIPVGETPPTANQVMLRYPVPSGITWSIAVDCGNSRGAVEMAATGSTVLSIQKCTGAAFTSCTQFGTVTFSAGGTTAAFSCTATSLAGGTDSLKVVAPASGDATFSKGAIELVGTR